MPKGGEASTSIRRRLLVYLTGSLLLVVASVGAVTYAVARRAATDAYDRSLLDPALDIADHIRTSDTGTLVDLPQKALEALIYDQRDQVVYQVRGPRGEVIDGTPELPPPPAVGVGDHRFFDGQYRGQPLRFAAIRAADGSTVQVGETLHKRRQLVGEILAAEFLTTLVVAAGALTLAWVGIAKGLRPLEWLRAELLRRSIRDLQPLEPQSLPREIAPVVDAFNRLLQQLREASAMQQRFIANAAHQLRTPLAGLQMHLEILLRQPLASDVRTEIDALHGATVRASRLASQLLALAKAEPGPVPNRPLELVDLRDVAGEAARDWAPRAIALDADLGFSLESALILGDRTLLPEIFNNLIDNALRYTPSGGAVTVRTGYQRDRPFLSVEDTGPGIPAEERANVVERFYRVSGSPGDGSGLGLSIVKEAVERHGGTLEIVGRPHGRGTAVRVTFPKPATGGPSARDAR
jgi:two-component system sensor histidine kinase TctE